MNFKAEKALGFILQLYMNKDVTDGAEAWFVRNTGRVTRKTHRSPLTSHHSPLSLDPQHNNQIILIKNELYI